MHLNILSRLQSLNTLKEIPPAELHWLSDHGKYMDFEPGLIISKGTIIDQLWIIMLGQLSLHVDSGAGPKVANTELITGSVTGVLPYSRLRKAPGDLYADKRTELLSISTDHFPEMIIKCPSFTTHTVQTMIDRTRIYNTSAMQDEKMVSLGRISAGLAHELNNPASVVIRDIKLLRESQAAAENAAQLLIESGVREDEFRLIRDFYLNHSENSQNKKLSALQMADFEEKITGWMEQKQLDPVHADQLAELVSDTEDLEILLNALSVKIFQPALSWIIARQRMNNLARDIEQSTTKIHNLVEAVKKFTHMDSMAEKEMVDIAAGIKNTIKMLDSKVKSKIADIQIEIEDNLPGFYANGAAMNQVWFNLLENALDAIPESGKIRISVGKETDQIVVKFIDNGHGIASEKMSRIFDPFYTTKAPGQGIGLGLDLSRRIIKSHKGDIRARCREGKTEFCVYFNTGNK